MRFSALDKKLDAICKDYDYGIIPGSVTVFVRDKVENIGKLELTILEGIMVIIEAFDDGFMVLSCIPITDSPTMPTSLKLVQDHLEYKFDTMDRLLMTISPLFAQRFLDRIQTPCIPPTLTDNTTPALENSSTSSSTATTQHQTSSTYNDIFQWIH